LGLKLFPNPTNGIINMDISTSRNAQLLYEVYDVMGRKLTSTIVGQVNAGAHRVTTDMASYAAGLYMIRVLNGQQEAVTELFLKE